MPPMALAHWLVSLLVAFDQNPYYPALCVLGDELGLTPIRPGFELRLRLGIGHHI